MCRRLFVFAIAIASLLTACGSKSGGESTPTPTSMEWPGQLEIIQPANWTRLQLLKNILVEIKPPQIPAAVISPDGKTVAIGSGNTSMIYFIDLTNRKDTWLMQVNTPTHRPFDVIKYLADGTLLANSWEPSEIYHIDTHGNVLSMWDGYNFAVSADSKTLAVGGTILVDIASNTTVGSLSEGGYTVSNLSFSPDGSKLADETIAVDSPTSRVWDIASQTRLATLDGAGNIRFSPNGKFLAVTSNEGGNFLLKIFDTDGKTQLTTLGEPQGLDGSAPLLSPDGLIIAVQISDGRPVAWNTTNWQSLDMPALEGRLDSFSPDGRILITRTSDGGILLWGVPIVYK